MTEHKTNFSLLYSPSLPQAGLQAPVPLPFLYLEELCNWHAFAVELSVVAGNPLLKAPGSLAPLNWLLLKTRFPPVASTFPTIGYIWVLFFSDRCGMV